MSSYIFTDPSQEEIELEAQRILASRRARINESSEPVDTIIDDDWLKHSFLIDPKQKFDDLNNLLRTYSTAEFKFQDTSLGGSYEINPRPQFTRYADTRVIGKLLERNEVTINSPSGGNHGMGHYYNEAIQDTSQVIHMRFGVPQFNSLWTFFTGFFSYKASRLARTGRGEPSIFFNAGQAIGMVSLFIAWPILLMSLVGNVGRWLMNKPSTAFYSHKPTMPVYWYAVNTMVNQIGINRGLYASALDKSVREQEPGDFKQMDSQAMKGLALLLPDIFSESGGIDVYNVANRAKRIKNRLDLVLAEKLAKVDGNTTFNGLLTNYGEEAKGLVMAQLNKRDGTIEKALNEFFNSDYGKIIDNGDKQTYTTEKQAVEISEDGRGLREPNIYEHIQAEFDDGSEFASFRVDYTGSVSESFSNNFVENDLGTKFNNVSSSSKAAYFAFSGYNVTGLLEPVFGAVKDVVGGVLESVKLSGLMALNGSAFVDIPKNWENSSVNFPKSNYTMTLISPYGNVISQMTNIYIPLCMLLAGCLPIQHGKKSYGSPFLVEMYDRGRQQTRLGMIDSVSIQRGTSNLGFNKLGNAMAIEVSFSIAELSSVLAMPIVQRSILDEANIFESLFDDNNTFTDYMNTLSSVELTQQIYKMNILQLNWQRKLRRMSQIFSAPRIAAIAHNFPPIQVLDAFFKGTDRI